MSDFVDAEGQPIAEANLAEAIQTGAAHTVAGSRVNLLDAAGRPVTVPDTEVSAAFEAGYTPESSEAVQARARAKEFGTLGQKAITGAEGVARGVTFGLSDVAGSAIGGEDYQRAASSRQEVNPLTAGAGELAGAVAPLFLSGGASAAASGARAGLLTRAATAIPRGASAASKGLLKFATAETAAGRMALRAAETGVTGALEGALYGAGQTAGGLSLSGDEITAEKVLSGAGKGALIGGLLGGAGGGIASKLEARGASKLAASQAAQKGDDLLMRAKLEKLESTMRKSGATEERITASLNRETERISSRASKLDRFAGSMAMRDLNLGEGLLRKTVKSVSEVDDTIARAGQDYLRYEMKTGPLAGKRIFHGVKNPVDLIDDISHAHGETTEELSRFYGMATEAGRANPALRPSMDSIVARADEALASLDDAAISKKAAGILAPIREWASPKLFEEAALELPQLQQIRAGLGEELSRVTAKGERSQVKAMRAVTESLDDAIGEAVESTLTRSGLDPVAFREAQSMAKSLGLVKAAVEDLKLSQASRGRGQGDPSAIGYAMVAAMTGNFAAAAAGGAAMLGKRMLQDRAGGIVAELAHRVSRSDVRVKWGAKALAGDPVRIAQRASLGYAFSGEQAARVYESVQVANADPAARAKFAAQATERFVAQYPELAMQAQKVVSGDLEYLAQNLPSRGGRGEASLTPHALKSIGNRRSERQFWERVSALEDPGYVIDQLMDGKVPGEAIEALKARRPLIWQELRASVMEETAVKNAELPFKRRITLGLAFDFASDKSLEPGMLQRIQSSIVVPAPPGPSSSAGVTPKTLSRGADEMTLPSDRLET